MSFDWKRTLGTVAPVLAGAFGGPMAAAATKMAADALGLGAGATESDIAAAVMSGDPQILLKLKQADLEFKKAMKQLDIDVYALDVKDRGNARQLAIAKGLLAQMILSTIFVCGFIYVMGLLFGGTSAVDPDMMQPAMYVLGILSAGIIQIMNFWFGSSSGSKEKDALQALPK